MQDSIGPPAQFSLTDKEYNNFKEFVAEKEFEYETASMKAFSKLVETAKREKYYELIQRGIRITESQAGP